MFIDHGVNAALEFAQPGFGPAARAFVDCEKAFRLRKKGLPSMKRQFLGVSLFVSAAMALLGCVSPSTRSSAPNPVVGAWLVKDPNAPFPYHMYVFNGDGTMQQANPDAGDPNASDSDGKGIWVANGDRIKGKWVEVIADERIRDFVCEA